MPDFSIMRCPNCRKKLEKGQGHFAPPSLGEPGFFLCQEVKRTECMACDGKGTAFGETCIRCKGTGEVCDICQSFECEHFPEDEE